MKNMKTRFYGHKGIKKKNQNMKHTCKACKRSSIYQKVSSEVLRKTWIDQHRYRANRTLGKDSRWIEDV